MKSLQIIFAFLLFNLSLSAQLNVTYTIDANTGYKKISPYIYGSCNGGYPNTTFMRQGGNRITGYNWENNASNAGLDWLHQSDDYLPWVSGIGSPENDMPGTVTEAFIDTANAKNAFSAVTLQMAGYVAKDKSGVVTVGETAPSARWCAVLNTKPSAFSMTPDLLDNVVYMDEYMNFLITNFGNSTTATGVKAFILDNETTLWPSTHPRIHPTAPTISEHLNKSIALATRIKEMDANAKIFGPESYGFYEYTQYQGASDWGNYSGTYPYFLSFYLDSMRIASINAGHRLLDVFSVHWYPDVNVGGIYSNDTTAARVAERIQLPRSLWDNTYIEDGWIGQWFSTSLPILPTLQTQIDNYYPNTELGITEYDYGADIHISGGLAQADALGGFARTGVSYASKWGPFDDFSLSAVQIYNDVANPFAGYYTNCNSNNIFQSTIHCSVEDTVNKTLHIIALNKNLDSTITATFNINSTVVYDSVTMYWFDKSNMNISSTVLPAGTVTGNSFQHILNKGSVYHFVLKELNTSGLEDESEGNGIKIYPNPVENILNLELNTGFENGSWSIVDMNGKIILQGNIASLATSINVSGLSKGNYSISVEAGNKRVVKKFVK